MAACGVADQKAWFAKPQAALWDINLFPSMWADGHFPSIAVE
jgi:hypothetical protein